VATGRRRSLRPEPGDEVGEPGHLVGFEFRERRPHGPAVGAGLAVALALDLRLCARSARLGLAFVNSLDAAQRKTAEAAPVTATRAPAAVLATITPTSA
jgi:hypothetical protein